MELKEDELGLVRPRRGNKSRLLVLASPEPANTVALFQVVSIAGMQRRLKSITIAAPGSISDRDFKFVSSVAAAVVMVTLAGRPGLAVAADRLTLATTRSAMLYQTGCAVQCFPSAPGPLPTWILLRTRKRDGNKMNITWTPPCKTLIR